MHIYLQYFKNFSEFRHQNLLEIFAEKKISKLFERQNNNYKKRLVVHIFF